MRKVFLALAALGLLLLALPATSSAVVCADYPNQAAAQHAADTIDADGDGRYCESLPCPCSTGGGGGGSTAAPPPPPPPPPPRRQQEVITATIKRVIDGDTVEVRAYGSARSTYKVRLIGIDTPEKYGGMECGARNASAYMERIAWPGRRVTLRSDPTQDVFDRYDRLLAYVDTPQGSLQSKMLGTGWAKVYVYGGVPFQRLDGFRLSASNAKRHGRGVWDQCGGNFHRRARAAAAATTCRNAYGGDVVAATNMPCWKARDLVRTWAIRYKRDGKYNRDIDGFRCRITPVEVEKEIGRCWNGRKNVRFYPNLPQ